jgi:hypothetical protein
MATGRGNQLTKQVGEFLVAAELARRGWLAAVLSGNTPDFDLVATDIQGRSVPIQVKAVNTPNWQFNAERFAEVIFSGNQQIIGKLKRYPANLVCVLVVVGEKTEPDQFFILTMRALQRVIVTNHKNWLAKHGGVRPKNPKSTHTSMSLGQIDRYRDNWAEVRRAAS